MASGSQVCMRQDQPADPMRVTLDALEAIHDFGTRDEAEFMWGLAATRRVLEIGTYVGWSACVWVLGGAQHVDSIDPHRGTEGLSGRPMPIADTLTACRLNLRHYGVEDRVTLHVGESCGVLPDLREDRWHLVFIDGDHDWALEDTISARRLLAPGGLLLWHDTGGWSAIGRAIEWARGEGGSVGIGPGTLTYATMP